MKRPVNELLSILHNLILDCGERCGTDVKELERDFRYIESRTKHEGLSFLTITLPRFCDEFFLCLVAEQVGQEAFIGMKRFRCLPSFLRGFTNRVFNSLTGSLLPEVCTDAIRSIRQICYLVKKIKLPCSNERTRAAYTDYRETDQNLSEPNWESDECVLYAQVSRMLCQNVFSDYNILDLFPKPGPGSVSERYSTHQKFNNLVRWPIRYETVFPYDFCCCYNINHLLDTYSDLQEILCEDEPCIRVGDVPKTQTAPRIIGLEPNAAMFTQQALKTYMYKSIESHWITSGQVNFTDQGINQCLALVGSVTSEWATLDMKKASDMVLLSHVRVAYSGVPQFLEALLTARTSKAELPDGEIITLRKFASMGSAICFPVEAIHFFCICVAARLNRWGLPCTLRNIYKMSRKVYVYGDDIIVPTDEVQSVLHFMHKLCAVVNHKKSFFSGRFRESCGVDAYDGEEITPIYLRNLLPQDRADTNAFISSVATGNQLYKAGYYRTFNYLRNKIDSPNLYGKLPSISSLETSAIGWLKPFKPPKRVLRYNKGIQQEEILVPQAFPLRKKDSVKGWPALLEYEANRRSRSGVYFFDALNEPPVMLPRVKRDSNGFLLRPAEVGTKKTMPLTWQQLSVRRGAVRINSRWISRETC